MMIDIKDLCFAAVALIAVLEAFEIRKNHKVVRFLLDIINDIEEDDDEER